MKTTRVHPNRLEKKRAGPPNLGKQISRRARENAHRVGNGHKEKR